MWEWDREWLPALQKKSVETLCDITPQKLTADMPMGPGLRYVPACSEISRASQIIN
jgi:hypothetical protein